MRKLKQTEFILDKIKIEDVTKETAREAQELIVEGLQEYFDDYDPKQNPDLVDLIEYYRDQIFLVVFFKEQIIATGGLIKEDQSTARVVRMSVKREYRRSGLATIVLKELEKKAKKRGYNQVVLETTVSWTKAIKLYQANGYGEFARGAEEVHFSKNL